MPVNSENFEYGSAVGKMIGERDALRLKALLAIPEIAVLAISDWDTRVLGLARSAQQMSAAYESNKSTQGKVTIEEAAPEIDGVQPQQVNRV